MKQNPKKKQTTTVKQKPLKSVKQHITEIVDTWLEEDLDKNFQSYAENYKIFSLTSYDPYIRILVKNFLYFSLNVTEVKTSQQLAEKWRDNKEVFWELCVKHTMVFCEQTKKVLEIADESGIENKAVLHELILSEITMVLQYIPSQFDKYTPDIDRLADQIKRC